MARFGNNAFQSVAAVVLYAAVVFMVGAGVISSVASLA